MPTWSAAFTAGQPLRGHWLLCTGQAIGAGRSRMADNGPMSKDRRRAKNRSRRLGLAMGATLIAAAVATELRKPNAARTWEGRIAGRVPYDLRPPTLARAQARLWNPADRRILVPTVFGVGWTVNFGRLLKPWAAKLP